MRRIWRIMGGPGPAVIFLAALAYRVVYFLTVRDDPLMTYVEAVPDASLYHNWAVNLLGGAAPAGAYYIGPAYAYFLALIYKIFGVHLYAVIIVQLGLGAATAALVYVLARRLFGGFAAAVAGGLWIFYLPAVFFDTQILPASLTLFLVTASLAGLAAALEGRRGALAAAVGAGALFAAAVMARPNLALFVPALALWPLLRRGRYWRTVVAFAAPVIVVVAAATVRNKVVADDWVIISSQGGVNFFIGNNRYAPGSFLAPRGTLARPEALNEVQTRAQAERALGRPLKASEASRWWLRRGLWFVARQPSRAALLYGRKLSLLTNSYEVTLNTDFNFRRHFSAFHRLGVPYYGLLFALGAVGLAAGWRRGPPGRRLLGGYLLATAGSVIVFFVVDWYRLPLAPALAVAAGNGVAILWEQIRHRRWLPFGLAGGSAALLLTYAWLPGVGVDRDAITTQSHFNYGTYYLVQGELEEATAHFRRALTYKEDNAYALGYLGLAYERQGRDDLASYYYLQALAVDPLDAETNYFLAANLARRGKYHLAVPLLRTAVDTYPGYEEAWRLLAECYLQERDFAAGAEAYGRVLALAPNDARALARYAAVLMELGRVEEGVATARRALAVDPAVPGAHLLLGRYYLSRGEVEAARAELEAEVTVAPRSPRAYALLAECYDALGMTAEAEAARRWAREFGGAPGPPPGSPSK